MAIAIAIASFAAYFAIRSQLRGELDAALRERAHDVQVLAAEAA